MNNKVHRKNIKRRNTALNCTQSFLFCTFSLKKSLFAENLSRRSTSIISVSSTFESYTASQANDGNLNTTVFESSNVPTLILIKQEHACRWTLANPTALTMSRYITEMTAYFISINHTFPSLV